MTISNEPSIASIHNGRAAAPTHGAARAKSAAPKPTASTPRSSAPAVQRAVPLDVEAALADQLQDERYARMRSDALPAPPGLWFLQDVEKTIASGPLDVERGRRGLPTGATLLGPASGQGLIVEEDGALLQPLEPHREGWFEVLGEYDTLAEVLLEVRTALN